ncbi:hypothetical protein CPAV1605_1249 [seawater metagenome]|uniref:Uncharacterized protein n=1 Tax=seawater metagenome TaxID=1561972 RepID=A0A5E8CJH9_9ZZZZ
MKDKYQPEEINRKLVILMEDKIKYLSIMENTQDDILSDKLLEKVEIIDQQIDVALKISLELNKNNKIEGEYTDYQKVFDKFQQTKFDKSENSDISRAHNITSQDIFNYPSGNFPNSNSNNSYSYSYPYRPNHGNFNTGYNYPYTNSNYGYSNPNYGYSNPNFGYVNPNYPYVNQNNPNNPFNNYTGYIPNYDPKSYNNYNPYYNSNPYYVPNNNNSSCNQNNLSSNNQYSHVVDYLNDNELDLEFFKYDNDWDNRPTLDPQNTNFENALIYKLNQAMITSDAYYQQPLFNLADLFDLELKTSFEKQESKSRGSDSNINSSIGYVDTHELILKIMEKDNQWTEHLTLKEKIGAELELVRGKILDLGKELKNKDKEDELLNIGRKFGEKKKNLTDDLKLKEKNIGNEMNLKIKRILEDIVKNDNEITCIMEKKSFLVTNDKSSMIDITDKILQEYVKKN